MGLFGKKKIKEETASENNNGHTLKENSGMDVKKVQEELQANQAEFDEITQKTETVRKEYDTTVGNLMLVKKELNEKKTELDVIQREHRETLERIKNSQQIKDSKSIEEFNKTQENLSKAKEKIEEVSKEYDEIKQQVTKEQSTLHGIRKQQIEVEKELDEANSRLYNAKEELEKKDQFQDTDILSPKEKQLIQGNESNQKNSAGIIEAASAVVGTLKSKLSRTQKELEAVQLLLEKEREEHETTKQKLEEFSASEESVKES